MSQGDDSGVVELNTRDILSSLSVGLLFFSELVVVNWWW